MQHVSCWRWPADDLADRDRELIAGPAADAADPVAIADAHRRELLRRLRDAQRAASRHLLARASLGINGRAEQAQVDDGPPVAKVLYHKRGHVAYVTLNRPEVLNALDRATHVELGRVWDDFEADDDLWIAVLTGTGGRAFSVGQDLKELAARDAGAAAEPSSFSSRGKPGWPRLTERFTLAKPIIARVNGYALGGGFELALACDVIVAAEHATFGLPESQLGLIPGAGGVFRLVRQLPYRVAVGMLMTGRRLDAAQALSYGLVNDVVPADALDECVDGWVTDLLACAPLSVRAVKEAAQRSRDLSLEEAFTAHYAWEQRRMHSRDAIEGPRAFAEKRRPRWEAR